MVGKIRVDSSMNLILKKRLRQLAVVVLLATILPFVSFPFMPHFLFVVATDSMSPTIRRGDIVVISGSAVENGSIVVFRNPINEGYEVHRICGTQRVGNHAYYVTKGDAIDQIDSFLIPQENVVGVVSAIVPYIGLYYLIPRLPALLITMSFIVLYVTIAFYENRRRNPEEKPEEKTSRNRKEKNQRTKKPTAKKMGAAALALFLISVLVQPPLMLAGVNLVYPGSQHPATVTTPKIALQNGIAGSSTIGDEGNSATVSVVAPKNWWNADYDYRMQITIVNNVASTLGSGYSVCLTLNTSSLVSSGKMLSSGNDLRIVYWNGSSWVQIDRDIIDMNTSSTQVWFKTQADISASGSDNNYYMYYGNPSAVNPPANKSNVYDFWDDFDDASLDPAWTFSQIGGASGSYSESGTVLLLNATTSGDLWDTSDNFLFLSITRSYDVLIESYTPSWGGVHDTWSKMGGAQLRQSLDANSKNRIMSPVYSAVGATNSYRLSTGGSTFEQTTATQPKYCRLSRIGGTSRAWYSTDGISWTELGSQISFSGGLSDPVRLGVHLAGLSSSSHWVEVDWFKVRKYVDPEPSASLGSEESNIEESSIEDYVDNNTSDVDSSADKGTHSDFSAQQAGPDSVFDTLTEENTGGWKVQSGTGSIASGSTYTTVDIDSVTLSKSFLLVKFGGGAATTQPTQDVVVSGKFNSASQLRFDRIGTTNPANFGWYVIEALSTQISVQSGTTQFASTETQKDVTITDVTDTSKCVVFLSRRSTGTDATYYAKSFVTGELTSATNLRLIRQGTGTIVTVEWFVVKFNDGTTIQTGETTVSTSNPTTQSISSVDLSRTWLYFTWRATANGLAQVSPRGWLESSTEIRWFRQTTTGICYVRWFVIQMPSGTSVQRGYHDSTVNTEYTNDITITSVALNRAFSFTTNDCTGTGTLFPRPFWIERITSTTNLHLERWYTGQISDHNWQIIELPTEAANYELDLEVQWTDIPALLPNGELCIYGGTMGSEDIKVDVWNGSAWKNVFTDLSTGWNNVSITSYLSGSTFTIRFKGATETGDTNQDSWEIDATLLHVWTGGSDYDYVLKVVNQVADNWKVNLKVFSSSNVERLSSATISFHDGTTSDQIIVSGGAITQSEGALYDLAGSATIYISMSNLQATTSDVSYLYVYLKAQIPGSGIHVQLQITFQIT